MATNPVIDDEGSKTALVLYGTETGTSQDLAKEISKILERHHFEADMDEFDNVSPQQLSSLDLTVFVLSTTGQGEFPSNALAFWTSLLRKKLPPTFLHGVNYVLFGLGDSSYPKFNWAARKLHKRIQQLGANSLLDPCEADEQGEDSTEGAFIAWSSTFNTLLNDRFPLPYGQTLIPTDQELPSKWLLDLSDSVEVGGEMSDSSQHSPPVTKREIKFQVTMQENERLTAKDHWQDVRFLRLTSQESVEYYPGDALAIKPQNMPDDVETLLRTLQWQSIADKSLSLRLNRRNARRERLPDHSFRGRATFTLRKLLTDTMDINAIPKRSFFGVMAKYTSNEMHKERLLEFTDPQYLDEYYDYATRPRRSILEILQEFDSVQIPWQEAINVFPFLRPRQFSIASGGDQKQGGTMFELLVAIVKYRTVIRRIRQGVCTRYLAQLPTGSVLNVVLKTEGRIGLPHRLSSINHLLIGAGTGIAPLRAIVHEKRDNSSAGGNTLVFGCRSAAADFFFKDEWNLLQQSQQARPGAKFDLVTAFSRDQAQKVYIQDRIRQHAVGIRSLILDASATIVVCGSSGAMPKAVRQALIDVLSDTEEGRSMENTTSIDEAEKFLAKLEKEGRYKQETW